MRRSLIVAGVLALLVACNSTEEAAPDTTAPVESSVPTADDSASGSTVADTTIGSVAESVPTTESAPVRGVEGDTVKVGFMISTNQDVVQTRLGTVGITFVPHQDIVDALVADLDAHGGLAGKTIVPVMYTDDTAADDDPQAISRETCATFTEDNEVYAVVGILDPGPEVLACLNDAEVPLLISTGATLSFADQSVYDANPLLFNPSSINLDRAATAMIEGLGRAGFFEAGAKVGLVRLSSPEFDAAANRSLEPALAAAGVEPVATAVLATINTNDDVGRFATEAQAAVLDMKAAGVTHLVFFESGGGAPFFFVASAKEQGFEPKLGLSTLNGGQTLVQNIATGGTAVAWSPTGDVPESARFPESEQTARCLDLIDSTRAAYTSSNATSETVRFCDAVWLLQAGVQAAGDAVGPTELAAAIEGLGEGYDSPAALRTTLGPGRHDGVSEYYITDYDSSCSCNVYRAGDPTPIR